MYSTTSTIHLLYTYTVPLFRPTMIVDIWNSPWKQLLLSSFFYLLSFFLNLMLKLINCPGLRCSLFSCRGILFGRLYPGVILSAYLFSFLFFPSSVRAGLATKYWGLF